MLPSIGVVDGAVLLPKSKPLFFFPFFAQLLCYVLFLSDHAAAAINAQGAALLAWKFTLNGSLAAAALSNWNELDSSPCGWFGVSCGSDGRVIGINLHSLDLLGRVPSNLTAVAPSLTMLVLSGTNLTGPIPPELGELPLLSHLDLSDNTLSGEIPESLFRSGSRLQKLILNSNRLEGGIPDAIGNLTDLRLLILYDNQLAGIIPASIGQLGKLEIFRAGGNKNLIGALPEEIGNCSSLTMIGLAETSITGSLPASLGLLQRLETLAVYTAQLSGAIPAEIGQCGELQNIYLYENSIIGSIPPALGRLKKLKNLLLWQNNLVGMIPPELGLCLELEVVDLSINGLTGRIPDTLGNLTSLQQLQLSVNQITGSIPPTISYCRNLTDLELDNNQISGVIPPELGLLINLQTLYLWQNRLEGGIPQELYGCTNLEAADLSQNALTGPIPKGIFRLPILGKLLLLDNDLSGEIPSDIGKCKSLIRFRANGNRITGKIPAEIGGLMNLSFLDLGSNRLSGPIPAEISGCRNLTFLDLHGNAISGTLPYLLFEGLALLQFVDLSNNLISGELPSELGLLTSLTKLILAGNRFSGHIPTEFGFCSRLQLLDLSSNALSGEIPVSLGKIPAMEIALNVSRNSLSGEIPHDFAELNRLAVLDLSHNRFSGDLHPLSALQNLVTLDISFNNFSGRVPNSSFFSRLPIADLAGNPDLCLAGCIANIANANPTSRRAAHIATAALLSAAVVLLGMALLIFISHRRVSEIGSTVDEEKDGEFAPPWEVTLYQKLDIVVADITRSLTPANSIGKGRSGVVYSARIPSTGILIAVKKFRISDDAAAAAAAGSEIAALARVRHRNIVRLLGWATNRRTRILFYDFMPNGTLGEFLHGCVSGGGGAVAMEWEVRLGIAIGVAEGLAYLHHDCVPAIIHRDVKADNVLLGDRYEACLADFGIACVTGDTTGVGVGTVPPPFAGSYGYIAPEYGCSMRITKKCDVFSFGVLLLELITGRRPADGSFGEGQTVAGWVRDRLRSKRDPVEVLDPRLQGRPDTQVQEMLQALGIALLCASHRPDDRPSMKDVAVLLREIRHDDSTSSFKPSSASGADANCTRKASPILCIGAADRPPSPPPSTSPSLQCSITYSCDEFR